MAHHDYGNTTARGYGSTHQKLRAYWKPIVATGTVQCQAEHCLMSDRWIRPGTPWDLGHHPGKTGYRGPEHSRCNRHEGQAMTTAATRGKPRRLIGRQRSAIAWKRLREPPRSEASRDW